MINMNSQDFLVGKFLGKNEVPSQPYVYNAPQHTTQTMPVFGPDQNKKNEPYTSDSPAPYSAAAIREKMANDPLQNALTLTLPGTALLFKPLALAIRSISSDVLRIPSMEFGLPSNLALYFKNKENLVEMNMKFNTVLLGKESFESANKSLQALSESNNRLLSGLTEKTSNVEMKIQVGKSFLNLLGDNLKFPNKKPD